MISPLGRLLRDEFSEKVEKSAYFSPRPAQGMSSYWSPLGSIEASRASPRARNVCSDMARALDDPMAAIATSLVKCGHLLRVENPEIAGYPGVLFGDTWVIPRPIAALGIAPARATLRGAMEGEDIGV
jgi:hypothetical protein